jgi:hypothetical protein
MRYLRERRGRRGTPGLAQLRVRASGLDTAQADPLRLRLEGVLAVHAVSLGWRILAASR